MMVIAVAPVLFLKKPAPRPAAQGAGDTASVVPATPTSSAADSSPLPPSEPDSSRSQAAAPTRAEDTVRVTSPLYTYGFSTRGARLVEARLHRFPSMAPEGRGDRAQIMPEGSDLLGLTVVRGRDTVDFGDAVFTPSADSLAVWGDTASRRR